MSAAERELLGVDETEERKEHIKPYFDMTELEIEKWWELINDFPPSAHNDCDRPLLRTYCEMLVEHTDVLKQSRNEDYLITTAAGSTTINPIFNLIDRQRKTIALLAAKLRMAPSGRANTYYESKRGEGMASGKPGRPVGRPRLAK
jgi:hypothetical protein